jgi:hypothetical protein
VFGPADAGPKLFFGGTIALMKISLLVFLGLLMGCAAHKPRTDVLPALLWERPVDRSCQVLDKVSVSDGFGCDVLSRGAPGNEGLARRHLLRQGQSKGANVVVLLSERRGLFAAEGCAAQEVVLEAELLRCE